MSSIDCDLPDWIRGFDLSGSDGTYTGKRWCQAVEEKLAIACYIADNVITDTSSVFFDAGSTLRLVAQAVFYRASTSDLSLIATTNNVDISDDFGSQHFDLSKSDVTLHLTGGRHDRNHHALFGELAAATIKSIYPRAIIMGISGFKFGEGLFYHGGTEEGIVKNVLYTKEVDQRVLAIEHSKVGTRDMFPCKSRIEESIDGLCKNVREKTIIVTSAPPDPDAKTLDVQAWKDEIGYLIGTPPANDPKFKETQKTISSWISSGKLEVVVVKYQNDPQKKGLSRYYDVIQQFPSI